MTKLRTHRLFTLVLAHSREVSSSKLSLPAMICIVVLFCTAAVIAAPAQGVFFTTLASFDGANGAGFLGPLVQAADGNFYGTTSQGGAYSYGTVFKTTPAGVLTTLYSFCAQSGCPDGTGPLGGVVQGTDGNFYGITYLGGSYGNGTVFKITPAGTLTTLYSFCAQTGCTDGSGPQAGLLQATDGNFYGTTTGGGVYGPGTVFKITPTGALTTLYSFDGDDGGGPAGALVQGSDGNFYGTTYYGGSYTRGTVFKISPGGVLTSLYSFDGYPYGSIPYDGLVQGCDGNFYGTTYGGGTNYSCSPGCGTVFTITPSGALTTLYDFSGTDGSNPYAGLVQGSDGNFYGTTTYGGAYCQEGCGTVFVMTAGGTLNTLHSFNTTDGASPSSALVQARNGYFYGTTNRGGAYGDGTVFRLGVVYPCATCRP